MCVDHVRVQSVRNLIDAGLLSPAAKRMLEQIAEGSLPPILVRSPRKQGSDLFGEELIASRDFAGPFQELDDLELVEVDQVVDEQDESGADGYWYWCRFRIAWDLPESGRGLLA